VHEPQAPFEDPAKVDVPNAPVDVVIDLHAGDDTATVWTSDLTHDYVEENSAYSS
jgi:glutamate N-acetyltransferase/amino-acid N-acetyltransferase